MREKHSKVDRIRSTLDRVDYLAKGKQPNPECLATHSSQAVHC